MRTPLPEPPDKFRVLGAVTVRLVAAEEEPDPKKEPTDPSGPRGSKPVKALNPKGPKP